MVELVVDAPAAAHLPQAVDDLRRRRRHFRRADTLQVIAIVSVAVILALFLADGGAAQFGDPAHTIYALGLVAGLVGAQLVLIMLMLVARVPLIERTFGHDKTLALHRTIGKPAFYLLLAHAALLMVGSAMMANADFISNTLSYLSDIDYIWAALAMLLFTTVAVTSFLAVRRRMRYEIWHLIHLLSYLAVAAALPHQIAAGRLFGAGVARWWWLGQMLLVALCLLVWRMIVPILTSRRHRLRVMRVDELDGGVHSVVIAGERLDELAAAGGQFFHWRFWAPGLWWQSHPYSLSAGTRGGLLRISVRGVGAGSRALARLEPGTRVGIAGPYGRFTVESRTRPRVALFAAGIGVAPVRAMLDELRLQAGATTVVLRSSAAETPAHLDELTQRCAQIGARLIVMAGPRAAAGDWRSAEAAELRISIAWLLPQLAETDLYLCGPDAWLDALIADLRNAGAHPEQLHVERFSR